MSANYANEVKNIKKLDNEEKFIKRSTNQNNNKQYFHLLNLDKRIFYVMSIV